MSKKLQQITDSIHETIYLSELENALIYTPFFYRLHDIYQSSTVYMTFPANRTKRYEHSIGTMHLAGEIFFSAVANSEKKVKKDLLDKLVIHFDTICAGITKKQAFSDIAYLDDKTKKLIKNTFGKYDVKRKQQPWDEKVLYDEMIKSDVFEAGLKKYMMTFSDIDAKENNKKYIFIYQCLLEAVRIVALFHDAGHPPFSHIIEEVLIELQELSRFHLENANVGNSQYNVEECKNIIDTLSAFNNDSLILFLKKDALTNSTDLHEQVGLKFMCRAIKMVIADSLARISNTDSGYKETKIIYYIMIAEFSFAILTELDDTFLALHRIIDGCIDADRLDYVVRDTTNSGVDWGRIPYLRIVQSAKFMLMKNKKDLVVAYPRKVIDDIEDLLEIRFKIFSRINFHHSCQKKAITLKTAVLELSLDYLEATQYESDGSLAICPEINLLWELLRVDTESAELDIIQWNDSWLITALYRALLNISDVGRCQELKNKYRKVLEKSYDSYDSIILKLENRIDRIKGLLEEILLNKKYYDTLFKRDYDWSEFLEATLNSAGIFKKIDELKKEEIKKYEQYSSVLAKNSTFDSKFDQARDSLGRFSFIEKAVKQGNIDLLERVLPTDISIEKILEEGLNELKENGDISDYAIKHNQKFSKNGLPSWNKITNEKMGIYLYSSNLEDVHIYDIDGNIKTRLNSFIKFGSKISLYVVPNNESISLENIKEYLSDKLQCVLNEKFNMLFGQ